jgi:hypothetical protein
MAAAFDPIGILSTLARYHVDYVLIGGLAGALHGSPAVTNDADICPESSVENLDRLATALKQLKARIRTDAVAEGRPFDCSGESLGRSMILNLVTSAGDLDLSLEPSGTSGYRELSSRAVVFDINGMEVLVASLDDIIHSKQTANRAKDHVTLPILKALRDELLRDSGT